MVHNIYKYIYIICNLRLRQPTAPSVCFEKTYIREFSSNFIIDYIFISKVSEFVLRLLLWEKMQSRYDPPKIIFVRTSRLVRIGGRREVRKIARDVGRRSIYLENKWLANVSEILFKTDGVFLQTKLYFLHIFAF